jgi:predicted transcriptional regulator
MRTTIDLPDDVHRAALQLARDRSQTLSRTVSDLLRRALSAGTATTRMSRDELTGLPLIWVGRTITPEDVAAASDDT